MMAIRELKVCLLGDTGVGKSSIVCRFVQDTFDLNTLPTIGASFMTKTVSCGNELHKFLIWDTAGQERESFYTLKKWVKELKEHGPENIVVAIAGNKCDLSDMREVTVKDAQEYVKFINAIFVETSAKNAINVGELFERISQQIPPLDPSQHNSNGAFKVGRHKVQSGRRCC
ncbi:ras-related protein Rab-31 isoform X2 [Chiloscyllium plagiosum]|uniref:ras-related protein Rab-31 isoform X2 n=1 Tax=Chiloscyllium plagiosum TaxID=36176 RepID=UPI001CB83E7D|nr:ras-related protein Rab-31 isoform X2 [Chiloscyllium plagiosum]